jgi:hypothetical protein
MTLKHYAEWITKTTLRIHTSYHAPNDNVLFGYSEHDDYQSPIVMRERARSALQRLGILVDVYHHDLCTDFVFEDEFAVMLFLINHSADVQAWDETITAEIAKEEAEIAEKEAKFALLKADEAARHAAWLASPLYQQIQALGGTQNTTKALTEPS